MKSSENLDWTLGNWFHVHIQINENINYNDSTIPLPAASIAFGTIASPSSDLGDRGDFTSLPNLRRGKEGKGKHTVYSIAGKK